MAHGIDRVISGGQTGVDRTAWDAAHTCGIAIGGFVPKGRMAEDGPIPADYGELTETESADPSERTRRNVEGADKTLILARGPLTGGTALTARVAAQIGRPCLAVDLDEIDPELAPPQAVVEGVNATAERIVSWLEATPGNVLNVAGPRASEDGKIYSLARQVLEAVLGGKAVG